MIDFLTGPRYTDEQLNARLKFFIGIILGLTLFGIVFVVLYSLIFVTQPMNGMSPVDNKFFELIIPIATFLTGTLSGIMLAGGDKDLNMKALEAANKPYTPPSPQTPPMSMGSMGGMGMRPSFNAPPPMYGSSQFGQQRMEPSFNLPQNGGKLMGPPEEPHPEI